MHFKRATSCTWFWSTCRVVSSSCSLSARAYSWKTPPRESSCSSTCPCHCFYIGRHDLACYNLNQWYDADFVRICNYVSGFTWRKLRLRWNICTVKASSTVTSNQKTFFSTRMVSDLKAETPILITLKCITRKTGPCSFPMIAVYEILFWTILFRSYKVDWLRLV